MRPPGAVRSAPQIVKFTNKNARQCLSCRQGHERVTDTTRCVGAFALRDTGAPAVLAIWPGRILTLGQRILLGGTTMTGHTLPYAVNGSLLFTEVPLLERPGAARAEGFGAIEFWWPWPADPVPADTEVDRFVRAVQDAGVQLIGLNFFAGDLSGPDAGVLSIPGRSSQFRDNIDVTVGIGERLGTSGFNALYGNRVDGADPAAQDELATENIALAAKAAARIGATVLIEPVSGPKPYPLRTAADAVAVVQRA